MQNPQALLSRKDLAAALAGQGFSVAHASLASMATRGGGPPFQKFGNRVLYVWADALEWAHGKLSPARSTTSEHRHAAGRSTHLQAAA